MADRLWLDLDVEGCGEGGGVVKVWALVSVPAVSLSEEEAWLLGFVCFSFFCRFLVLIPIC